MNNSKYIDEDELDLTELWKIIVKNKIFILFFTFFITIISIFYVNVKTYTPIYSGSLLVEIGEVKTENPNKIYFDRPVNLKFIIEEKFSSIIEIPKRSDNLIVVNINDRDKNNIESKINDIFSFILNRHKEKTRLYNTYIMTKKVSDIKVEKEAINKPKKKLIVTVSFFSSLILSFLISFFIEFISKQRRG